MPRQSNQSQWYPSPNQLQTPQSVAAALKQILDQHYALAAAIPAATPGTPATASGPPPGSGPVDSMLVGLHVAPIDTQSLADNSVLSFTKRDGNLQFVPGGGVGPAGPAGPAGPSGPVTSVAQSVPSEMTIAGSPITTFGTLAIAWNSASGNKVIASPAGGGAGAYAGRALVAADIPTIPVLDAQGPTGTLTGDSTDQTVFTKTISAARLVVGSQIRVTFWASALSGAANRTVKLFFGSTAITLESGLSTNNLSYWSANIVVTGATAQTMLATGNGSGTTITNQIATPAEAISGTIVLKATFNVDATVTYKGQLWLVEILNP